MTHDADSPAPPTTRLPAIRPLLLLLGLALAGLSVAGYALAMASGSLLGIVDAFGLDPETALMCDPGAEACAAALLPAFSEHLGVPIPMLGIIGYGALAVLSWRLLTMRRRRRLLMSAASPSGKGSAGKTAAAGQGDLSADALDLYTSASRTGVGVLRVWAVLGVAASSYFVAFQFAFTPGLCPTCMMSAGVCVAIAMAVVLPRDESFGLAPGDAPMRLSIPVTSLAIGVALALGAGAAFGLRLTWDPIADAKAATKTFLADIPPRALEEPRPMPPRDAERPRLIFAERDGCIYCAFFYEALSKDKDVRALLATYDVLRANPLEDLTFSATTQVRSTPGIVVLYPSASKWGERSGQWGALLGYRDVEVVRAFLRDPLDQTRFPRPGPAPTISERRRELKER